MNTGIERIRGRLPDVARDIRLNLDGVFSSGSLTPEQRWGVALACAASCGEASLTEAVLEDARREASPEVIDDALAAAALMAMNNVYYRFRHMVGKSTYSERPARLRMNRLARPATTKAEFELYCLAVSAIHGCELCVRSHEQVVTEGGLGEEQVHDAVRIAAVIHAAAVSLTLPTA